MRALSDLVGMAEPLNPAEIQFTDRPGQSSRGCIFKGQRAAVCYEAARLAVLAELADCDAGVVYVLAPVDPRQSGLF